MASFIERLLNSQAESVVTVEPDFAVINDGVSNSAVDEISSVRYPERVYVIYDHDVPTGRPEAAAILRKNLAFADKYHCKYIQAKGAGYQYMLNEIVKPGQIVIGAGSHAGIFGAKKALGINVSIPELARIIETGRYSTVVPETVYVNLKGKLKDGVSAIDSAFAFLKNNRDLIRKKAIEIYAPELTQHELEVFCSIACITGAYTVGISESEHTDAININLQEISSMLMLPCETRSGQKNANFAGLSELSVAVLNAGQIGGYTGGTIEDLRAAAKMIEGKKLALGFRLSICPATSKDYIQACNEGLISRFIDYGAQINAAGDHSEVIQGPGAMGANEKLITTGLYTYSGAMGVESSLVYSGSVQSVINASFKKGV